MAVGKHGMHWLESLLILRFRQESSGGGGLWGGGFGGLKFWGVVCGILSMGFVSLLEATLSLLDKAGHKCKT